MKKILSATVIGSLLAVMVAVTVRAQIPGTALRVSIPFDFIVSGKNLPAGNYEIRRINDEPSGLLIRSLDSKHDHAMFETEPVYEDRTPRKSLIVFHHYNDSYFLSQVVTAGEETARELPASHAERTLRREMASNNAQPETVSLAAY